MKKLCTITAIFLLLFPLTSAGQDSVVKVKLYNTWIKKMTTERIKSFYTYSIEKENIIVVSKHKFEMGRIVREVDLENIAIHNIKVISFRKQGNVWKKGLIGAASAFVIGGTIGFFYEKDYDPEEPEMWLEGLAIGGAVAAPFGFVIGSAFGFIKNRFSIHGNRETFEKVRTKLEKRSIRYYY